MNVGCNGVRWVCDGFAMGLRWVCDGFAMGRHLNASVSCDAELVFEWIIGQNSVQHRFLRMNIVVNFSQIECCKNEKKVRNDLQ